MGLYSLSDLEYMFWAAIRNGSVGTIGAKGDPGGFTSGTVLGISNLNDIKTAGIYRQASGVDATAARNYPSLREGILLVHEISGTGFLVQEYIPFTQETRVTYRREFFNPTWSPWRAFTSERVNQTAGRAIYQWDDVNNREQLVYGDTGERVMTADTVYTVAAWGSFRLRRIGTKVTLNIQGMDMTDPGANPNILTLPDGFRPAFDVRTTFHAETSFAQVRLFIGTLGQLSIASRQSGSVAVVNGIVTYDTNDAWPTTLPGTASGTIPNL